MSNIEQLEERITQLTELVNSGSEAIKSMEAALRAAEEERDRLADQRTEFESKYRRVKRGDVYFSIGGTSVLSERMRVERYFENDSMLDQAKFLGNNYFYTASRAGEIADKIDLLLKLERFHDIYCRDYKAEDDGNDKYSIVFCDGMYQWEQDNYTIDFLSVYFPTEEIAQKVCNILNEELDS